MKPKFNKQAHGLVEVEKISNNDAGLSVGHSRKRRSAQVFIQIGLVEFANVMVSAYLASVVYYVTIFGRWPPDQQYIAAAIIIAGLIALVAIGFQHYVTIQIMPRQTWLLSGLGAVALAFSFFLTILFVLKDVDWYSRGTFLTQMAAVGTTVVASRAAIYEWYQSGIRSGSVEARRAVLIGPPSLYSQYVYLLKESGIAVLAQFPFPNFRRDARGFASGRELGFLIEKIRDLKVDDVLIFADASDFKSVSHFSDLVSELPVSLHLIPASEEELLTSWQVGELGNLTTIRLLRPPLSSWDEFVKRTFDLIVATIALISLAPILLMVSLLIKLDSRGPVFFRQIRQGYNNEIIEVFKFRTMTVAEEAHNFRQATRNDPRVTRVGRFLRRSNLDELPQLFNVLANEMSIVGPRPHPVLLNEQFNKMILRLSHRLKMKPGITGWAQVNGYRGETDSCEKMQRRLEHDLYYIENWSFFLDLKIMFMTLFSRQAYANAY